MAHLRSAARAIPLVALAFPLAASGQTTSFEVASVRLSTDDTLSPSIGLSPGRERFMARHMPLLWLIASAYDVSIHQVSGLPKSFDPKHYDIEGRASMPVSRKQMMRMLGNLIEDRFKLRLHRETKQLRVYVLHVSKGGPKLKENKDGADLEARNSGAGRETYRNFPMSIFANILSAHLDDTVVDRTGLNGSYDFKVKFTPERLGQGAKDGHEPAPNLEGPDLLTALKEQLGLELKREVAPVTLLSIDHIEDPAEN